MSIEITTTTQHQESLDVLYTILKVLDAARAETRRNHDDYLDPLLVEAGKPILEAVRQVATAMGMDKSATA